MTNSALTGIPASGGLAFGPPIVLRSATVADDAPTVMGIESALQRTADRFEELAEQASAAGRTDESEVLEAYAMIAEDPALLAAIQSAMAEGHAAIAAVRRAVADIEASFRAMTNAYLAARADDVAGVGRELVATLTGTVTARDGLPDGAIVCARDLTPADTVHLDLERLGGLVTERGGPTSHTAIVARSLAIPAVVAVTGLLDAVAGLAQDDVILIDGDQGEITIGPDTQTIRDVELRLGEAKSRAIEHRRLRGTRVSFDGKRILVAANVGTRGDLDTAVETAADGVGLFRSEFLFLDRDHAPTTEEQRDAYLAAVRAFEDPTVVRTLDIGGDKEVAYLDLPTEDNPFLGVRGLRLCLREEALFDAQLDALVGAAVDGRLRVMFPMVASLADLDAGLTRLSARADLAGSAPPDPGIMIETPAAALLAPHLARRCAFFSIGTNDLAQYTTGADRGLGELGSYQDPAQPAVLQLVAMSCEAAAAAGIPVAVCGEAASDPAAAALLLGLGVDELSVAPSLVDRVRWLVTELDPVATRRAAQQALRAPNATAVREIAAELLP
ncbi:MAG: phosphoenolpyruvate--protein phosphotransferase [Nitriliruptoraceae bacterium]|nr:phosphoenolpyruvate--protein phosphotransferase [Nitriliruptoraceae bacterium]